MKIVDGMKAESDQVEDERFLFLQIFGGSWLAVWLHRLKLAIAGATSLR